MEQQQKSLNFPVITKKKVKNVFGSFKISITGTSSHTKDCVTRSLTADALIQGHQNVFSFRLASNSALSQFQSHRTCRVSRLVLRQTKQLLNRRFHQEGQ